MDLMEKVIDLVVWAIVIGSIFWMAYGTYEMINLIFLRS
jgi:hypothetical protein